MTAPNKSSVADTNIALSKLAPIRRLPGVTGIVVATMDGRTYLSDLVESSPGAAAAVTASSLGLGARLGELTEAGSALLELQVRSKAGYVCLYVINNRYLLGVITTHAVNLALLKLEVRDVLVALNVLLPAEAEVAAPQEEPKRAINPHRDSNTQVTPSDLQGEAGIC